MGYYWLENFSSYEFHCSVLKLLFGKYASVDTLSWLGVLT